METMFITLYSDKLFDIVCIRAVRHLQRPYPRPRVKLKMIIPRQCVRRLMGRFHWPVQRAWQEKSPREGKRRVAGDQSSQVLCPGPLGTVAWVRHYQMLSVLLRGCFLEDTWICCVGEDHARVLYLKEKQGQHVHRPQHDCA